MQDRKIVMMRKFQFDAQGKVRMFVIIALLLSSGVCGGFKIGHILGVQKADQHHELAIKHGIEETNQLLAKLQGR